MPDRRPRRSGVLPITRSLIELTGDVNSPGRAARVGLAAFALGLSLAGPQALGVATADRGGADSHAVAADKADAGPATRAGAPNTAGDTTPRAARGTHGPAVTTATDDDPSAPTRSRRGAVVQQDPPPIDEVEAKTAPESAATIAAPPPPAEASARPANSVVAQTVSPPMPGTAVIPVEPAEPTVTAPAAPLPVAATPRSTNAEAVLPVLRALSTVGDALAGALAGHGPVAPAEAFGWAVLAAASRETFAPAVAAGVAGTPSTTTAVLAIPDTPLFTALRLQYVPILGPLLVTPIVSAVSQIPVVGDLLHPIFGYPIVPEGFSAPRDVHVVSFDGSQIDTHFMPAAGLRVGQTAPTVMLGSGLGMPGATTINGTPLDGILTDFLGAVGIATLRNAGYNVVTWDPRGEYFSGGVLQIDSPAAEARDASAIINWIAAQPETKLDSPGDPRLGMVGPSYGGGIQLVTAATDHRVDAIVPTIAWNTLGSALDPNGAFKSGWGTLLGAVLALTLARVNSEIFPALIYGDLTGRLTPAEQILLAERGPGPLDGFPDLVRQITAPTLLIQGTVDTLFSLEEADATARTLIGQGVPTKVLWFCGGHGLCVNNLSDPSDGALIDTRTVQWLDRYVKAEPNVSTGPGFEWVDQRGQHFSAPTYSLASADSIVVTRTGSVTLPLVPVIGGSGPLLGFLPIGGTKALNAIDLTTPAATTIAYIVGAPALTLNYSGTGVGDHVYAQLVDDTTGLVLGNQVTPIPVTLDGQTHTVSIALQPVAQTLRPGKTVTLQLIAWSADYAANRTLGELTVDDMRISLPTNGSATPTPTVSTSPL